MTVRVGINGFGRMGRLVTRVLWPAEGVEIVRINDPAGDAATLAHLLNYDSVHGRWDREAVAGDGEMRIDGSRVAVCRNTPGTAQEAITAERT